MLTHFLLLAVTWLQQYPHCSFGTSPRPSALECECDLTQSEVPHTYGLSCAFTLHAEFRLGMIPIVQTSKWSPTRLKEPDPRVPDQLVTGWRPSSEHPGSSRQQSGSEGDGKTQSFEFSTLRIERARFTENTLRAPSPVSSGSKTTPLATDLKSTWLRLLAPQRPECSMLLHTQHSPHGH